MADKPAPPAPPGLPAGVERARLVERLTVAITGAFAHFSPDAPDADATAKVKRIVDEVLSDEPSVQEAIGLRIPRKRAKVDRPQKGILAGQVASLADLDAVITERVIPAFLALSTESSYASLIRGYDDVMGRFLLDPRTVTFGKFLRYAVFRVLVSGCAADDVMKTLTALKAHQKILYAQASLAEDAAALEEAQQFIQLDKLGEDSLRMVIRALARLSPREKKRKIAIRLAHIAAMMAELRERIQAIEGNPYHAGRRHLKTYKLFLVVLPLAHQAALRGGEYTEHKLKVKDLKFLRVSGAITALTLTLRDAKTVDYVTDRGVQHVTVYRRPDEFDPVLPLFNYLVDRGVIDGTGAVVDPEADVFVMPDLSKPVGSSVTRPLHKTDVADMLRDLLRAIYTKAGLGDEFETLLKDISGHSLRGGCFMDWLEGGGPWGLGLLHCRWRSDATPLTHYVTATLDLAKFILAMHANSKPSVREAQVMGAQFPFAPPEGAVISGYPAPVPVGVVSTTGVLATLADAMGQAMSLPAAASAGGSSAGAGAGAGAGSSAAQAPLALPVPAFIPLLPAGALAPAAAAGAPAPAAAAGGSSLSTPPAFRVGDLLEVKNAGNSHGVGIVRVTSLLPQPQGSDQHWYTVEYANPANNWGAYPDWKGWADRRPEADLAAASPDLLTHKQGGPLVNSVKGPNARPRRPVDRAAFSALPMAEQEALRRQQATAAAAYAEAKEAAVLAAGAAAVSKNGNVIPMAYPATREVIIGGAVAQVIAPLLLAGAGAAAPAPAHPRPTAQAGAKNSGALRLAGAVAAAGGVPR